MSNIHSERYKKLINYYKNTIVEGYVEKHHIMPKCLGGSNDISNLVALPPRAHYIAHYLLWKMYPENKKIAQAFGMMAVNNPYQHRVINSRFYELGKIARSKALKGEKFSEERKQKMRVPKKSTDAYKKMKNGAGNKGKKYRPREKEHIDNLRSAASWYYEKRKNDTKEKMKIYREEFINSGMTRKEFAELKDVNYVTMKRYLKGL